ncbi:unnamed protein product [Tilletia controversa]|uniref:NAD-dependent epimerase/dehydratase domain-containing protein n=3 Tax=Tilletia TaxID=13289 RepID=A0A8X7MYD3_9BASI|nr:hypothetical protein CF328_g3838 [Tilletia controversa]KAE8199069.1 hypothetical protein CF336_g1381 [Tilletia laevis]KAE8260704.1 hypothetical protein A4X03_0g3721 [Tilletia caries]KAE8202093.1 hypothetical protein CF335_g3547 [Tilletia laevis]KAE8252488.1 hypothetical protein A4X06_0g2155 [Tilletia controversa]
MTTDSLPDAVSVLICGGMQHLARPLLWFLADDAPLTSISRQGPHIQHVRVVDKFIVSEAGSSLWVDPRTHKVLRDPRFEYKQANLTNRDAAQAVFRTPDGKAYDFVFDLTGEGAGLGTDLSHQMLFDRTTKLARQLAQISAKEGVRAHVRDTGGYLTIKPDEPAIKEGQVGGRTVKSKKALWWSEAERAAADVPGLNLVITRSAGIWGPFQYVSPLMPRLYMGQVYSWHKEAMNFLWGPELRVHSIHADDWAAAAWQLACWMAQRGRAAADVEAGEDIARVEYAGKDEAEVKKLIANSEDVCPRDKVPRAPVFNVVDDNDTDQGKILEVVGAAFNVETGFVNAAIATWAKLHLSSVVDDVNAKHFDMVFEMLKHTNPPVTHETTPLTSFLDAETLANRALALDGSKLMRVIGWKPTQRFSVENLLAVRSDYQGAEGSWPTFFNEVP